MVSQIQSILPPDAMRHVAEDIAEHVGFELVQVRLRHGPGGLSRFEGGDADAIVHALGYDAQGGRWRELERSETRNFIVFNVGHDLAYTRPAVRPQAECELLGMRLLDLVGEPMRCFTRHSKETPDQGSYRCDPIRDDWTFSEPYLLVNDRTATLCTFLAED